VKYSRGDVFEIYQLNKRGKIKRKNTVVFVKYDPVYPRDFAFVMYAYTRHTARVPLEWLHPKWPSEGAR